MLMILVSRTFVLATLLASVPLAQAVEIIGAQIDSGHEQLVLHLTYPSAIDERNDAIALNLNDCEGKAAPVSACEIRLVDHDANYRYGPSVGHVRTFQLRELGLLLPAYSRALLTIKAASTSAIARMPPISTDNGIEHHRMALLSEHSLGRKFDGFRAVTQHGMFRNLIYGLSYTFSTEGMGDTVLAYATDSKKVQWQATLDNGNAINFVAGSPSEHLMVIGGRFTRYGAQSNLRLVDASTGETMRDFVGVEGLDVSSAYWLDATTLVSHASLTKRTEGDHSIVDFGYERGVVTWHDVATGRVIRSIDSPLLEARVIEQSSDNQFLVLAGYEGAAILDANAGQTVFSLHFSDIYGPEYQDCTNFGCGARGEGFSSIDVSADRRLFAVSTTKGPIYIGSSELGRVTSAIAPVTPDGKPLFIRTLKLDPISNRLYVFGAEAFDKPSMGHVLVYNLSDSRVESWYQARSVMGVTGGGSDGSLFSKDLRQLITADANEGFSDVQMLRPFYFRIYELER